MAIEAVFFDLDDTLSRRTAPRDWNAITALQVAALTPHWVRFGFGPPALENLVPHFWASFDALYPDPDRHADAPIEDLRWREGPRALRQTLAEYGVACSDSDAICLWEALHSVPPGARNHHLYPDAAPTVRALAAAGYRLAVVTARPTSSVIVARELREQGLPEVLAAIVTTGDVGYRKPHPLLFETALNQLGVDPAQAVMVGDSYELDIVPAASLGMVPVLKLNDGEPDQGYVLARYQVASLSALLDLEILH